jgi:hypothetical protein
LNLALPLTLATRLGRNAQRARSPHEPRPNEPCANRSHRARSSLTVDAPGSRTLPAHPACLRLELSANPSRFPRVRLGQRACLEAGQAPPRVIAAATEIRTLCPKKGARSGRRPAALPFWNESCSRSGLFKVLLCAPSTPRHVRIHSLLPTRHEESLQETLDAT